MSRSRTDMGCIYKERTQHYPGWSRTRYPNRRQEWYRIEPIALNRRRESCNQKTSPWTITITSLLPSHLQPTDDPRKHNTNRTQTDMESTSKRRMKLQNKLDQTQPLDVKTEPACPNTDDTINASPIRLRQGPDAKPSSQNLHHRWAEKEQNHALQPPKTSPSRDSWERKESKTLHSNWREKRHDEKELKSETSKRKSENRCCPLADNTLENRRPPISKKNFLYF